MVHGGVILSKTSLNFLQYVIVLKKCVQPFIQGASKQRVA